METREVEQRGPGDDRFELYKLALEDYHFQVQLNWGRSQYFLVLNLTVIGIASGIVQFSGGPANVLVGLFYVAGAALSIFSIAALQLQRRFYISAREQKKRFEEELGLGERSILPVQRAPDGIWRYVTFKGLVNGMLGLLGVVNTISAIIVFWQ